MYRQEFYVYQNNKPQKTLIRNYTPKDFPDLIQIQRECFPPPFPEELWWNQEQLTNHVTLFPLGALCAVVNNELAGSMTGLLVKLAEGKTHSWAEITDEGYIRNHDPQGDTLYVVDIAVKPRFRQLGLGTHLMHAMYDVVVKTGVKRLLGGGRMPGYYNHHKTLTPEAYLEKVITGELQDPVISFLLRAGRMPVGVAHNYLDDQESCNCAALMEWRNPFIQEA